MQNEAAVAAVASWLAEERVDLIVVTGDLTAFGDPQEFASAAAWIGAHAGERLVVPGNHDTPYLGLLKRITRPFERYEALFGPADGVAWQADGLSVAGINTTLSPRWWEAP
jgi:3',5'-cyclic AMP phosphodiesterase CpdA